MTPALAMTRSNGSPAATRRVGAGAHAGERREVELDQLEAAAIGGAARARPRWRRSALSRSRAAPTTGAPWAASARAVSTPRPAETPVTRTRLPLRSTPSRTSSVVDSAPNGFVIRGLSGVMDRWRPSLSVCLSARNLLSRRRTVDRQSGDRRRGVGVCLV